VHYIHLDFNLLNEPDHSGVQRLLLDLNQVYRGDPALHACDTEPAGFRWIIGDDRANSVFAFVRLGRKDDRPVLVVANLTPTPRHHYRIGVPRKGAWREIANTDSRFYGGSDLGNEGAVRTVDVPAHGEPQSVD